MLYPKISPLVLLLLISRDSHGSQEGIHSAQSGNKTQSIRKHIIVATLESAPFMMKRHDRNSSSSMEWYGYCMDFFEELRKHLPYELTYEIYQVADNKFGSKSRHSYNNEIKDPKQRDRIQTERWNGLIGDLQRGKAHLALAPLAVMAERELAIDFTVPFYDLVGIQILLKKPEVPQDWFKFLTVLDKEVWFSITVAYLVTSFVMFLFDRLSPYSHKNVLHLRKLKGARKTGSNSMNKITDLSLNQHMNSTGDGGVADSKLITDFINIPMKSESEFLGGHLTKIHSLCIGSSVISTHEINKGPTEVYTTTGARNELRPKYSIDSYASQQRTRRGSRMPSNYFQEAGIGRNDESNASEADDGRPDFGLRDSLWFCITSLTPQGGGEAPQNLSGRVVAGAWWLFCFIIIASYTANLAAFLTVSRLDIPIESLDDLAKQYRIKYAPIDGTAEQTYFERMAYIEEIFYDIWKGMSLNDSLAEEERSKFAVWDYPISDKFTKIWAQIQQVGMPENALAGIGRVKSSSLDDGFALLADANMVRHAVMTDCSFKAVGDEFSRKPIALGLRKGDDKFRDDLSYAILQLINQRYMEILREKWWTNNPSRVICDNNDESEGISVENIGGVFVIIFAGVLLSFIVWALERFVYKSKLGFSQELVRGL